MYYPIGRKRYHKAVWDVENILIKRGVKIDTTKTVNFSGCKYLMDKYNTYNFCPDFNNKEEIDEIYKDDEGGIYEDKQD